MWTIHHRALRSGTQAKYINQFLGWNEKKKWECLWLGPDSNRLFLFTVINEFGFEKQMRTFHHRAFPICNSS
jgi:hypothetical protein